MISKMPSGVNNVTSNLGDLSMGKTGPSDGAGISQITYAPSETTTRTKVYLTKEGESIIGLRDATLIKEPSTLTTTIFDTTTYPDRAILKLQNATGGQIVLTGLSIRGKIVSQIGGRSGYVWEYSDYDSIEKEGERSSEISNELIFDPAQAKQIGDFAWKELKPHKLYSLMLFGCHYEYEIGDVYHLTLTHTMAGGTMEDIDTDVEITASSISRSVGDAGMTLLELRVPSDAWALTIARNSKLVGAAKSQWLNNRSNVVTVASSTWTKQADYFCDGTNDQVEIQAAIDYIYSLGTGGSVYLTSGTYNIASSINAKSNIIIKGSGISTKLISSGNIKVIDCGAYLDITIQDLFIQAGGGSGSYGVYGAGNNIYCNNITINNCQYGIYTISIASACVVYDCDTGIYNCTSVISCYVYDCDSYGILRGNISSCIVINCYVNIEGSYLTKTVIGNNKSSSGFKGITVNGNCICSGNQCYDNTYGIEITGTIYGNNVITGNRCTDNTTNYINLSALPQTVSGNDFT